MDSVVMDDVRPETICQEDRISERIAERIGSQKYKIWFERSVKINLCEEFLKVAAANQFIVNWIESRFAGQIKTAVKEVTGEERKLTFVVDSSLACRSGAKPFDVPAAAEMKLNNITAPRAAAGQNSTKAKLTLQNFVVGSSNQLAYNAALTVVRDQKVSFNPLFVHGGYGVGKTHLLQGICNEVGRTRPGTVWLYLSAEDFVNQFVLALKTKKLEAFRRRLRQTDLLAIDDVHFLASKPSTQEEFLHTFNAINLAGKQVIMASDSHPKMINQLSEKLVNRFVSGMVVKINPPDFQTRCQICKQYAENLGKSIPETVIRFIAEHLRNNVRELEGALLKLTAFSSLQNEKISLSMAQSVLVEHLARTDPIVHISDIVAATAAYFGITTAEIHSPRKDNTVGYQQTL